MSRRVAKLLPFISFWVLSSCGMGVNVMQVNSVSPSQTLWTGTTAFEIRGSRFTKNSTAYIDGTPCRTTWYEGRELLRCYPQFHTAGDVSVRVITGAGESATFSETIRYDSYVTATCTSTAMIAAYRPFREENTFLCAKTGGCGSILTIRPRARR